MLKATTVAGYVIALRLSYLPLPTLLIAMAWYTCKYFGVGRPILAMVIRAMWALVIVVDAFAPFGLNLKEIYELRLAQTPWGESFALPKGASSPLHHLLNLADATLIIFVVDASATIWRRGNRRAAIYVGVGITGAVIAVIVLARLTDAGVLQIPHVVTFVYMVSVYIIGYPLSAEVLRSAQLERQLQVSEAKLSETGWNRCLCICDRGRFSQLCGESSRFRCRPGFMDAPDGWIESAGTSLFSVSANSCHYHNGARGFRG